MIGGLYLCFEGVEKLAHSWLHRRHSSEAEAAMALNELAHQEPKQVVESESDKIKGAVRTDFVLSAEIIAITLGTVAQETFGRQVLVLSAIALVMTIGVYGLVAGIVKLDDAGLYLSRTGSAFSRALGRAILWAAPFLMKFLSIAGTVAMFLVGGGIVTHGIPPLHHAIAHLGDSMKQAGGVQAIAGNIAPALIDGLIGILAGIAVLLIVSSIQKLRGPKAGKA
jgi:predicted DNA repair protein MutK